MHALLLLAGGGYTSEGTDAKVQANIGGARYGQPADARPEGRWGYAAERLRAAAFLQGRFNAEMGLLQGVWAGGEGYEANGFSLIDVNYFASRSLGPYNATMARLINRTTARWLRTAGYAGDDRRENLFGRLATPIYGVDTVTVAGAYPAPPSQLWVCTERANKSRPIAAGDAWGINAGVTLALSRRLAGDGAGALAIMQRIAAMWNGTAVCFMEPYAVRHGVCHAREISYFLFGARALRLPDLLPKADFEAMERQLWSLQVQNCSVPCGGGKALVSSYRFGGEPILTPHSSTEPSNLALLAYDERILTEWFPA